MPIQSKYSRSDVENPTAGTNSFVPLPVPHLKVTWKNGEPAAAGNKSVAYFGGFYVGTDLAAQALADTRHPSLPNPFVGPVAYYSKQSRTNFDAYETRLLYAAPILTKDDWWLETDKDPYTGQVRMDPQTGKPAKRKKHRVDILCFLASLEKDHLEPWDFAVLSKIGYAGSGLAKAFREWEKMTRAARDIAAPDLPTCFFYVPIGTFGDQVITLPAGQSSYTPAQIQPLDWTKPEVIESLYVGSDLEDEIVSTQKDSLAWKEDSHASRQKEGEAPEETYEPEDPFPPLDEPA